MPDATPPVSDATGGPLKTILAWVFWALLGLNTFRGCANTDNNAENARRLRQIEADQREIRAILEGKPRPSPPIQAPP